MDAKILIVGGYGEVGRRMASLLAAVYGADRIVVGGRNPEKAAWKMTARIDVDDPATIDPALEGVSVVAACVRQREPHLLRAVARRGLAYTSIAPPWIPSEALGPFRAEAQSTGARLVLAAGIEPGISSVLARAAADRIGPVEVVETGLLLGVGDAYGSDSMGFIVDELVQIYSITINGTPETAHAFERPRRVLFPEPIGARHAYLMPFRDQLYYPMTLGAKTSIARLALDPPWVGAMLSILLGIGGRALLARRRGRSALHGLSERLRIAYQDRNRFALVVDVRGARGSVRTTLIGREQAQATAVGAAAIVEALMDREIDRPGVFLAEEVVPVEAFLRRLAAHGLVPAICHVAGQTAGERSPPREAGSWA